MLKSKFPIQTNVKCHLLIFSATFLAGRVFGWGPEGHQTVAELARTLIADKTRAQIVKILNNDDLGAIATWADDVRGAARGKGPLVNDPEAIKFNKSFPNNHEWHFVNLALGTAKYTDNCPVCSPDDVVHAINNCIATLEGHAQQMTKLQALRLLVHFAGDIHQPLHVGTGYYNAADVNSPQLITDPVEALSKPSDVGGNDLFYGQANLMSCMVSGTATLCVTSRAPPAFQPWSPI